MPEAARIKVFISYSHDDDAHRQRVLALAQRLRNEGLDCQIDKFLLGGPAEGWPRWTQQQIKEADFVLVVCTETYKRRFDGKEVPGVGCGADWEGVIVLQQLYNVHSVNERFVPVLFDGAGDDDVPLPLQAYTRYRLPDGYDDVYRYLTKQPATIPAALGDERVLPPVTSSDAVDPAVDPMAVSEHDDATRGPRLRLVLDGLEKYRRREPGKDVVFGAVDLEDGTAAFGEGVVVHLTVENTATHSLVVSGLCVCVEAFDPYPLEDFDYSEVAVASTHLEVPGTTTLEPLQLTNVEQHGSTLRIPPGRLFLGPANTPEAFHSLQFPVVAHVAGRWRFHIEVSTGLSPNEGPPPPAPTASVTVVKR